MRFAILFISFLSLSFAQAQSLTADFPAKIQTLLSQDKSIQKLGKYLVQMDSVKKVYERISYQPIWVKNDAVSAQALAFIQILNNPNEFGFAKNDFIDPQLQELLTKEKTVSSLFWLEILLTDKWIQMSKYLYQGRLVDYHVLDDDTKLARKNFNRWDELKVILSGLNSSQDVKSGLEQMEPKNRIYKGLKKSLAKIIKAEKEATWQTLVIPKHKIQFQASDDFIKSLKIQLGHFGFAIDSFDPQYDVNLREQLSLFHKYFRTQEKDISASLIKILNVSLESRKEKIFIAMEKARMLADDFEPTHIFVNLAFQEFKFFDNGQLAMEMKTINGQKFRRTPTMKDFVTVVELNPTWSVPVSIALRDKLSKLKENPAYLSEHNMTLYDGETNEEIDPFLVDWSTIDRSNFNFRIVQGSGNNNALGLVKFPLTNPWAIYLHDTNERNLFSKNQRLISSGCIRLEKPFTLAEYILRDQPLFTAEKIKEIVETGLNLEIAPTPTRIKVKKSIPIYMSFITTDVTDEGILRFSEDVYGSDARLTGILSSKDTALDTDMEGLKAEVVTDTAAILPANKSTLSFSGNPTAAQISKVIKLYKCVKGKKNSCELKHVLEFNKNYSVDSADYIAIYENQIYAEVIRLAPNESKTIQMLEVQLPDSLASESRIKLFHDFNFSTEQKRVLMENFYFSQSPLKYSQYDFGDFYLSSLGLKVINERIEYSLCQNRKGLTFTEEANGVCRIYKNAKSPEAMRRLFTFGASSLNEKYADGEYSQLWVSRPGDIIKVSHKRRLLAAPLKVNDRVIVFPGVYKARGEQSGKTVIIKATTKEHTVAPPAQ